ncbi:MAG TPA: hypothetical protein VGC58_01210 [Candidatus Paceibacterota bacterium]
MLNNKVKTIVGVILLACLAILVYIYFFKEKKEIPSLQEMRARMVSQSSLNFAVPTGFVNLKKEELSKDLQIFVPTSPQRISILELEDGSQKDSYKILLEINQNMHDYYLSLRQDLVSKSWREILSKRSDLVSIAEFENSLYEVRVETVLITDKNITAKNLEQVSAESKKSSVTILIKSK